MSAGAAPPRHLVLVGLMGSGKTTVGRRCAERLGRAVIDTDELVEALAGRTVEELFAAGEAEFRIWERQAVAEAAAGRTPAVISCGGGAVLDVDNRAALRGSGFVVWLRATPKTLAERVGSGAGRPLLAGDAPLDRLRDLADERGAAYAAAAHAVVETDGRTVADVTDAVLAAARIIDDSTPAPADPDIGR